MTESSSRMRILHVDDHRGFAELAATVLERENDGFSVETASSADGALERLDAADFECVVSDYEMPGRDGLELLQEVRERYPDLPFILFTGRGSEDVASDAISAGVTDYLQKGHGTEQYAILANRIENAVESRRARRERRRQLDAIETAQEGISVLDEEGRFIYVNEAYADLYGYTSAEMVDEHWELIYREEDVPDIRTDVLPQVRETGYWRGVTTGLRSDGSTFVEDHVLATTDRGEIVCTVRDVTETRERQEQLEASLAKFEALFESSPDMIATHDEAGEILDVNQRMTDRLDYSKDDLVGMRVWELDRSVDPAGAAECWTDLPPEEIRKFDGRYRRRDGSTFPVEVHLVRLESEGEAQFLAISHDVTERRERERAIERTNAVLSTLVETLPVGILVEDDARTVMVANRHLFELFGLPGSPGDVVGRDCERLAGEVETKFVDSAGFVDRIDELIAGGRPVDAEELTLVDGRRFERSYRPISLPDGSGHLWVYRNVTARADRERELERQNDRLEAFVGVVSHDLRNPLNVARGRLDLAREGGDGASDHLDAVEGAHDRMAALIEDLLTLAREGASATESEPLELAAVSEECWRHVETADATRVVETTRTVRADRGRLQQLLENLVRNAVEHGGDAVTVTVGDREGGFYLADDGAGIPEGERERVFEAGYSLATGGTGFGLTIAREIANAHGWTISAAEGPAGGTRFDVAGVEFVDE